MPINEISEKHYEFTNLLGIFLEHGYRREDGENLKDIDAIQEYVSKFDTNFVQKGLAQAKEILAMDQFPDVGCAGHLVINYHLMITGKIHRKTIVHGYGVVII